MCTNRRVLSDYMYWPNEKARGFTFRSSAFCYYIEKIYAVQHSAFSGIVLGGYVFYYAMPDIITYCFNWLALCYAYG